MSNAEAKTEANQIKGTKLSLNQRQNRGKNKPKLDPNKNEFPSPFQSKK